MKFVIFLLFISSISIQTFARSVDRTLICKSESGHIFVGSIRIGYNSSISLKETRFTALPSMVEGTEKDIKEDPSDADVLFTEIMNVPISAEKSFKDCVDRYKKTQKTKQLVLKFDTLSQKAQNELEVQAGRQMTFVCDESIDVPISEEECL